MENQTEIEVSIQEIKLTLLTTDKVFSPKAPDRGTLAMLSRVLFSAQEKVLDLGCGYGLVGLYAAKSIGAERVVMCDNAEEAVRLSRVNAEKNGLAEVNIVLSDGFTEISDRDFTLILSNPPYHTDFSVAKHFIEQGYQHLKTGGRMMMVTKRQTWYQNKLKAIFGGVMMQEIDGYYVFTAEKRIKKAICEKQQNQKKHTLSKKLQRKADRANPKK